MPSKRSFLHTTPLLLGAALWSAPGCGESPAEPSAPQLAAQQGQIRNGTREPEAVLLSEGQQLAIGWLYNTRRPASPFCTGTLIAPHIVATAQHCTDGERADRLGFGVGLMPNDPEGTFKVKQIYESRRYDAALLVLEESATQALPHLVPIPFNREQPSRDLVGREVQVGGYGETFDRTRFGRYFATVELTRITGTDIVVNGRGRQGICFGDSGGPVITPLGGEGPEFAHVLGVESWGDSNCLGVDHLTRLDILTDWIDEVFDNHPEPGPCEGEAALQWCEGSALVQCAQGEIERVVCPEGEVCGEGVLTVEGGDAPAAACVSVAALCAQLPAAGRCEQGWLRQCEGDQLVERHCAAHHEVCLEDEAGARCEAVVVVEPDAGVEDAEVASDAEPIDAGTVQVDAQSEADAQLPPEPRVDGAVSEADAQGAGGQDFATGALLDGGPGGDDPDERPAPAPQHHDGCQVPVDGGAPSLWMILLAPLAALRRRRARAAA